jgi:hypothetical protein
MAGQGTGLCPRRKVNRPFCPEADLLCLLFAAMTNTRDKRGLNQGDPVKRVSLQPSDFKTGTRKLSFDQFAPPC